MGRLDKILMQVGQTNGNPERMHNIDIDAEIGRQRVKDMEQDREQRKTFAYNVFAFLCAYCILTFVVIFFVGIKWMELNDYVLGALIVTTFGNILATFNFVMRYLFRVKGETEA